nr:MAG TPA: hypothetical protein [Caudoviricetes sp.]
MYTLLDTTSTRPRALFRRLTIVQKCIQICTLKFMHYFVLEFAQNY